MSLIKWFAFAITFYVLYQLVCTWYYMNAFLTLLLILTSMFCGFQLKHTGTWEKVVSKYRQLRANVHYENIKVD